MYLSTSYQGIVAGVFEPEFKEGLIGSMGFKGS